jgi:hypothetical protein
MRQFGPWEIPHMQMFQSIQLRPPQEIAIHMKPFQHRVHPSGEEDGWETLCVLVALNTAPHAISNAVPEPFPVHSKEFGYVPILQDDAQCFLTSRLH